MTYRWAALQDVPLLVTMRKQQLLDEEEQSVVTTQPDMEPAQAALEMHKAERLNGEAKAAVADMQLHDIDDELKAFFAKALQDGSLAQLLVEEGGKAVATAGLVVYQFPPWFQNPNGKRGYIASVYTVPEYRGRGLAKVLLERLIAEAKKRGIIRVFLGASPMGRGVYQKMGFKPMDTWMELRIE